MLETPQYLLVSVEIFLDNKRIQLMSQLVCESFFEKARLFSFFSF